MQLTQDETAAPRRNSQRTQPQSASVPHIPTRSESSHAREDPLLLLKKYDTVIIVDDSASMAGPLWFEARFALAGVAELAGKYDTDGIDVHFLNDRRAGLGLRTAHEVERLFDRVRPDAGITPTGEKLEELLLAYLLELEKARDQADEGDPGPLHSIKPVNFIILTDGAPTDDPESVIVTAARRLDARNFPISQVGIQFVQIGNDPKAAQALQELDDELATTHGIRDMVDTTPYSGGQVDSQMLTKILLGGINRRVDKRGVV